MFCFAVKVSRHRKNFSFEISKEKNELFSAQNVIVSSKNVPSTNDKISKVV